MKRVVPGLLGWLVACGGSDGGQPTGNPGTGATASDGTNPTPTSTSSADTSGSDVPTHTSSGTGTLTGGPDSGATRPGTTGVSDTGPTDGSSDTGTTGAPGSTGGVDDPYLDRPGVWPISATKTPDCIQDGFAHRLLGGDDDFHPGLDTCDDNPLDGDGVSGNDNDEDEGFPVHVVLDGEVTRVRLWDPEWNTQPERCPSFCRQGNFVVIRHPSVEDDFGHEVTQTIYMHLAQDSVLVSVGDMVTAGQEVATVGRTGQNINTTHLHLGLTVGTAPGLLDSDAYRNPLHVLPYPKAVETRVELERNLDGSMYDAGECAQAIGPEPTMTVTVVETEPALDTSRVELRPVGGPTMVLDMDQRIAVGIDGAQDDFGQGCVAVEAENFNEASTEREIRVHFGGEWADTTEFQVGLIDVRGAPAEHGFSVP